MSLQIVAVKEDVGFNKPQLDRCPSILPTQLVTAEAEKPINKSSTPGNSTIHSLDFAKSSRLVSESLDRFFPIDPTLNFPLY